MSFRRKKKQSFKVEDVEAYLRDHQSIEFAGSGDPHEEKGKIRLLLENLKAVTPDILLFDGDYLAEPAYLKAGMDQAEIAKASVAILKDLLETLHDCPVPSYCVAGNYEMFGTTSDAVEEIGSDQIFDVGSDKKSDSIQDRIHPDDVYMDLQSVRTTWPGGVHESGGFAFIGVEGSNPINQTFPGERSENNLRWAIEQATSKVEQDPKNMIIATHSPPFGMRDRLGRFGVPPHLWGAQKGSVALRELADEKSPFMILVGHIHEAFGVYVSVKSTDEAGETVEESVDIDFGNRSKITIGYDTSKTSVTITLNKGTLEYWNWSRVRIAEEGNLRIVDIEGEWLDRKGRKKPFKKFNQVLDYDGVLASQIG
ncbi:MAG: metallophosphoesterase family protein [Candidatus Thorarchaeota archaeon]|jgi:Icc-related predicted phosphoesterase